MASTILSILKVKTEDLQSFYLQVNMNIDNRKNSPLAILNKLSRELLFFGKNFGGFLVCPERDQSTIHLILHKNLMDEEEFQNFLKQKYISVKHTGKCDSFALENCMNFSFFYYMEKAKWHQVGNSLFQEGFLSWKLTNISKIDIKVHVTSSGEIFIKFTAEYVRIYPFEHWLLDSDERFEDVFDSRGATSKEVRIRWVTCLPRLGKGRLVRVHKQLPADSPFHSYKEMRSYWKNTYGYNLPAESPEVYYDILFHTGEKMLYPFNCILTGPPETIQLRTNSAELRNCLKGFLKDFKEASITLFGDKVTPILKDDHAIRNYLDVLSMPAVNSSRLKSIEKIKRKDNETGTPPPPPKIIRPSIPIQRSVDESVDFVLRNKRPRPTIVFK